MNPRGRAGADPTPATSRTGSPSGRLCLILAKSDPTHDPRVWRCAETLNQAGYEVVVAAHEGVREPNPDADPAIAVRLIRRERYSPLLRRLRDVWRRRKTTAKPPAPAPHPTPLMAGWFSAAAWAARDAVRARRLARGVADLQPAIVHAHDEATWPAALRVARLVGCPVILDMHEFPGESRADWGRGTSFAAAEWCRRSLARADAVVAVSDVMAQYVATRLRIRHPVAVWSCPTVEPIAPAAPAADGARPLRVLYHGLLDVGRGVDTLIRAAARVDTVEVRIRGAGPVEQELRSLAAELGLSPEEVFLPPVPMAALVHEAAAFDVGALPISPITTNKWLCAPNKLFEYMAAGLCVVASDLPVLRQVLVPAGAGYLLPPDDVNAWASFLQRLAGDRDAVRAASGRAHTAAVDEWSWERQAPALLGLYRDLLTSQDQPEVIG